MMKAAGSVRKKNKMRQEETDMTSDPVTLYKLMTLYLLRKVNFPLTNAQMSELFLEKGYTNYLTFQQVLSELAEAHLIRQDTVRNTSRYEITTEGEETLGFFKNRLSDAVIADMDQFVAEHKFALRSEIGVTGDYYRHEGEYQVELAVKEGKSTVIGLTLAVPDEAEAVRICEKWSQENQAIYAYVMKKLM